ncbi:hypothetical protein BDW59DRAFT_150300 [Aspergillus cavernicola]|uniref:Uncharacterized protein n=1 Tax=Aspergillus cavernicola TaxID=176166 RepID=A0ABR4I1S0_9EURO
MIVNLRTKKLYKFGTVQMSGVCHPREEKSGGRCSADLRSEVVDRPISSNFSAVPRDGEDSSLADLPSPFPEWEANCSGNGNWYWTALLLGIDHFPREMSAR